jgi:peptidoglycan hydrolase-like amidase
MGGTSNLLGFIYEYELAVSYKKGQLIIYDGRVFEAILDFTATSGATDSVNNMKEFDVPTTAGEVVQVGPFDALCGRIYGNNTITLEAPTNYAVVGYRMYGVGANNYPDGGSTGSSIRHWMYCRRIINV